MLALFVNRKVHIRCRNCR